MAEHHVTENLENEWTDAKTHREPLRAFFSHEIANAEQMSRVAIQEASHAESARARG